MNKLMKNKKGSILVGLIAFIVAMFFFAFMLPLIRTLINDLWSSLGSVEQFFVIIIPITIFILLIIGLLKLLGGGE